MTPANTDIELEHAAPGRGDGGPAREAAFSRRLALAAFVGAAAAVVWIGAAVLSAGRGFDVSDEGYYLLSYRWWDTNLITFTGVQYLYGPVFQALGHDIAALRLFRLLTVVAVHLVFGWTFMCWLRQRRPGAPASRVWEIAGVAAIVASGGMVYGWLPLTAGYNDVSLLGGLLAASIVLRLATYVERGSDIPAWVPAAFGPVAVTMLLAKWSSAIVTLGLVALIGLVVVFRRGPREVARLVGWVVAAALVTAGLIHVFVVALTTALPAMLAVNRRVAAQTNSPLALVEMYWTTGVQLVGVMVTRNALLLLAAAIAVVGRRPAVLRLAAGLAVAGLGVSAWQVVIHGGLHGGTVNLEKYPVGLVATLTVPVVIGLGVCLMGRFTDLRACALYREGRRGWAILGMLALLPLAQAFGTGNPLYFMAINAFAAWMTIIIAVLTGIETAPAVARWLAATVAACAVVLSSAIATDGLWSHPYRTVGHDDATAVVSGVPALDSVRLDPGRAQAYSELHRRLEPYLDRPGRAVMAFDEMPGIVLLLDGRPVGEAWYSATDHARSAAGIRAECSDGQPSWWESRLPILMFNRPISDSEVDALRSCGLVFATDYRQLAPKEETMGLWVFVPTAEAA